MKSIYLLFVTALLCSCTIKRTQEQVSLSEIDEILCKEKMSEIRVDIIGSSRFICFTPEDCTLEYVVNTPPQKSDLTILFCAAASFTGQRMSTFDYSNICGTYIADSMVRNFNIQITNNIDASFAHWDGKWQFAKGKSPELLDSALQNKGVFFMQKQVLCDGERGMMNLTKNTIYRVLAEYNDKLCIIQNTQPMVYTAFVEGLGKIGVKDAVYLDMGGWSYSWYRNVEGKVIELFPISKDTKYQTNWIVFRAI